jgi:uncharacterized membrane protein/mono/diheme cytochrome c family protein
MLTDIEIFSFVGHLHPLLVHLPIGILLAGFLLHWLSRNGKNPTLRPALLPLYFVGFISALLSCISGYILSIQDEYDSDLLNTHFWMGIGVAIISLVLFLSIRGLRWFTPFKNLFAVILFPMILYTAHLGGELTHGSNFLFATMKDMESTVIAPLPNAQEAIVYNDIIQPILRQKCYACHGPQKQKGKLRLDSEENILKGSKNGKVIKEGKNEQPELLKRILLPPDDEDHMPPKEKGQLSKQQIMLIQWWLENGADFKAKAGEIQQNDTIKKVLASLEENAKDEIQEPVLSMYVNVPPAEKSIVDSLKIAGLTVLPLGSGVNALGLSMINVTRVTDTIWSQIARLCEQVYVLDAAGPLTDDNSIRFISKLNHLQKLNLSNSSISDSIIPSLGSLQELAQLNITGTKITNNGLDGLKKLKKLKSLYIFRTNINLSNWEKIKLQLPGVIIDTGGYTLPVLTGDTSEVKPNKN